MTPVDNDSTKKELFAKIEAISSRLAMFKDIKS